MNWWVCSLAGVFLVSLLSFTGAFFITLKGEKLGQILLFLVSFAAGSLLGDVFFHLIPEVVGSNEFGLRVSLSVLAGLGSFFVLEKFIHWRHCHVPTSKKHPHPLALMNLVGDGLHNFIDGLLIAASFWVSYRLGITTLLAVIFHEIPQEIGDLGVLIHGGLSPRKALFLNFASALAAAGGVILVSIFGGESNNLIQFLIPFTAGGFLYIAGSDLIPELHKEIGLVKSLLQMIGLILGVGVMRVLLLVR